MKKPLLALVSVIIALPLAGCGPHFYKPGQGPSQPAEITVSAYTQSGCLEELEKEARSRNVQVKLKDVQSDLGWEILFFPVYKGYKCIGTVVDER